MATVELINSISIDKKINQAVKQSRFSGLAKSAANTRFVIAKQIFLEGFQEHEVTKELKQGPINNNSKFLPRGGLFSFLGFEFNEKPEEQLQLFLQNSINMESTPTFIEKPKSLIYSFKVHMPSKKEVYDAFPANWVSKSWIDLIENSGVSNFGAYIYHLFFGDYSRSRTGLQNKKSKNPTGHVLGGIKYVSELLDIFKSKFKKR